MVPVWKRVAGIGAAVAMIATAGPVAAAGAATLPALPAAAPPAAQVTGPFQTGAAAGIAGWNAGVAGGVGGLNAGAAALGLPFQLTINTGGPFGLDTTGLAPLAIP